MQKTIHPQHRQKFEQLKQLSILLDSKFEIFGIRFGLDAIVGLVPVVGDFITSGMSIYIIAQAAQFGCGASTLLRMGMNLVVENVIDMVPFLGNFVDVFWRANNKNMDLLAKYMEKPQAVTLQSRLLMVLICLTLLGLLIGSGVVAFYAFEFLYHLVTQ